MKKYLPTLEKCPLFSGIDPDDILPMLGCLGASVQPYEKNEVICHEGDADAPVGILLSGAAQIVQDDFYGNRTIVTSLFPSHLFGETFACAGIRQLPVSILATEKCEIMRLDCQRLLHTCSHACAFHSRLILNLVQVLAAKNLMFHRKIDITSRRTTREKLMAYLMDQARQHHSSAFTIPYDRQALADYLGVDRSALSAEISKLRSEGKIESSRSFFRLL